MSPFKFKRRWLQFSVKGLLIATGLIALLLGRKVGRVRDQVTAVAQLQRIGARVWYQYDQKRFVQFWLSPERIPSKEPPGPAWLRQLIGDDYFRSVVQVDLVDYDSRQRQFRGLDDQDLQRVAPDLGRLPALETIWLSSEGFSDAGLAHLENLSNLKSLTVNGFPLTDNGLKHIGRLRSLESLNLRWTEVTDEGLIHLSKLANLRRLFLYSPHVTRRGLPRLASLPKLEELILYEADVSDADLKTIMQGKPNLRAEAYRTAPQKSAAPGKR